jgi:hypothetical protein
MIARTNTPIITPSTIRNEKPFITTPRAVPAAGGCSELVIAMVSIAPPTAKAYIKSCIRAVPLRKMANSEPNAKPIMCPKITFLVEAVTLLGIANIVNAVAANEAATTKFCCLRAMRTKNTLIAANILCKT